MRALQDLGKHVCYRILASRMRSPGRAAGKPSAEACRRVLLSEISLFGDAVSFTYALSAARRFWPTARLDVLMRREYASLVRGNPNVNNVAVLDDMTLGAYLRAIRSVQRGHYDLVVSMSPGLRNAGMATLGTARGSAGYLRDQTYPPHFLNQHRAEALGVSCPGEFVADASTHIVDRGLGVLRTLGAEGAQGDAPAISVQADARDPVEGWLRGRGLPERKFAVIHPSAGDTLRRWPVTKFGELTVLLKTALSLEVVWLGSALDGRRLARAAADAGAHGFFGRGLDEVAALMQCAALFVGNDSGPMHLAGAMRTPLVGIFGTGDPARLLPRSGRAASVGEPDRAGGIEGVSVQEVFDAARVVLGERGKEAGR